MPSKKTVKQQEIGGVQSDGEVTPSESAPIKMSRPNGIPTLTDYQKAQIDSIFEDEPDLSVIVKKVFNDPSLDGRSSEGKAVAQYLGSQGKEPKTTKWEKVVPLPALSEEQILFLSGDHIDQSTNRMELVRTIFKIPPHREISFVSQEYKIVYQWLKANRPEVLGLAGEVTEAWSPPRDARVMVSRINFWCHQKFNFEKESDKNKRLINRLLENMRSPLLRQTINAYDLKEDRELFESQFIQHIWDKPDLATDELAMYITICGTYIDLKRAKERRVRLEKLEKANVASDKDGLELTIKMAEHLKAAASEINDIEKRQAATIKQVNEVRNKRIASGGGNVTTMMGIVEAFQDKTEREQLRKVTQLKKKLADEAARDLETVSEMKARILGISKREVI